MNTESKNAAREMPESGVGCQASTAEIDRSVLEAMPDSTFRITLQICRSPRIPYTCEMQRKVAAACQRLRKRGLIRYDARTGWSKV